MPPHIARKSIISNASAFLIAILLSVSLLSPTAWSMNRTGDACAPATDTDPGNTNAKETPMAELLENPGFERGLQSWSDLLGGQVQLDAATKKSGNNALKVVREKAGNGPSQDVTRKLAQHGPGIYKLGAWLKLQSGIERVSPVLHIEDDQGERSFHANRWCLNDDWTKCSRIFDITWHGELRSARVSFQTNECYSVNPEDQETFGTLFIDDCSLTKLDESRLQTVTVDAAQPLGPADQIRDFFSSMVLGGPESADKNDTYNRAWRELGFLYAAPYWDMYWLIVKNQTADSVELDYSLHDKYMLGIRDILKSEPYVDFANKASWLSSNPDSVNHYYYMPESMDLWKSVIADIVRHNVEVLGMKGLWYMVVGEPYCGMDAGEYVAAYSYADTQDKATRLRNNIELHVVSSRLIKSIEPSAKMKAAGHAWWKGGIYSGDPIFNIEEWIKALKEYNDALPPEDRIYPDCIEWQDYSWLSDRISDGADVVSHYLAKYGLDPDIPKLVTWSDNYGNGTLTTNQRASHIMYNLVREFRDPAQRRFARATHYYFPGDAALEDDSKARGGPTTQVFVKPDGSIGYNPDAVPYQIAGVIAKQQSIVRTSAPEDLHAMAASTQKQRVVAAVNNNTVAHQQVEVVFQHLPFEAANVTVNTQRVDKAHSLDGDGLEPGETSTQPVTDNTARVRFNMTPYSTTFITLTPHE